LFLGSLSQTIISPVLLSNRTTTHPQNNNDVRNGLNPDTQEIIMKRNFLTLTLCFVLGIAFACQVQANENNTLASAFGSAPTNNATSPVPKFATNDLQGFLSTLPVDVAEEDGVFNFKYKQGDLTLPIRMAVLEGGTEVWAVTNLDDLPDNADPAQYIHQILKLLASNGSHGDYFFKYQPDSGMIQLWGCFQVRHQVSHDQLNEFLQEMSACALKTVPLWNTADWGKDDPMYVGTWHSADNKMTLDLNASKAFHLDHNGQKMSGKFAIDGDSLQMRDTTGDEINATIRFDNANQFTLSVNGVPMVFVRQ